ncbi:hypothetical protein [uncultured Chloroflexus sp.]|uniref:hypothetical protein n=1 Tax=uncultured Chloroflexus sp. TaxID=214040 RepID=UPI00261A930D|nr:hypothetical protein [uncultured Chloroflexus sp.]
MNNLPQAHAGKSTVQPVALVLPLLVILSISGIFLIAARWLGREAGYLGGFAIYWLV